MGRHTGLLVTDFSSDGVTTSSAGGESPIKIGEKKCSTSVIRAETDPESLTHVKPPSADPFELPYVLVGYHTCVVSPYF